MAVVRAILNDFKAACVIFFYASDVRDDPLNLHEYSYKVQRLDPVSLLGYFNYRICEREAVVNVVIFAY